MYRSVGMYIISEVHYSFSNETKMNIVRCPKPPKGGGSKTQNGRFPCKIAYHIKKICYKVSLCEYCQRQSCKACLSLQKWLAGNVHYYVKICQKLANPLQNADFQSLFARSALAVTPSEKRSINTNRKSITSFPMSLR